MTDDLVKRARDAHQDSSERTYKIPLIIEMADRIEALTAKVAELEACLERQGSGHREDLDEIANVSVARLRRAEAAEAERDRLTAIGTEMAESIEGNYYLPGVVRRWFIALSGETP